jgi:Domain of unknown function (DUF1929)
MRTRVALALSTLLALAFLPGTPTHASTLTAADATAANPASVGVFGTAFEEPGPNCTTTTSQGQKTKVCKPAAVSVIVLPDHRILYWDGLEGFENIQHGTATEAGDAAINDQSRVLTLGAHPSWAKPTPVDGGANPKGYPDDYLFPNSPAPLDQVFNDKGRAPGALFCSDQVILENGDVLTTGGTSYYAEPRLPGTPYGVAELEGLRNTRIFHPQNNSWTQTGSMHYGRWYPGVVTLPDGDVFVGGGVTKLIKPMYPNSPSDSGHNVMQTETFHLSTGKWTYNGTSADKSFPLFPRLHLLPDGKIYYDAVGQVFNPDGQDYYEAQWNDASVYDPVKKTWTDVGTPQLGFRGSTFSIMLPLAPPYTKASFLVGGGIIGVTPGTYFAVPFSRIDTIDTAEGDAFTSTMPGNMVNARWYSSGVLLPTGQVMAFSGANRDEVVGPGTGNAIKQAELFDPETGKWTTLATAHHGRTYHNTAALLPDGSILVGGHSPIPTGYGNNETLPGGFSNNFRDPSFEIYKPPYFFWGPRPVITNVSTDTKTRNFLRRGRWFRIDIPHANRIENAVLVRNTAITHLTDGDQREIQLEIISRSPKHLEVALPWNPAVTPPGPYMLFVNARSPRGLIPSVAKQVFVG